MKKILFAIAAVSITGLSASAYVDNQYMTTPNYMLNTGYSTEMTKMINVTSLDPYREPYSEKKDWKSRLKRSYSYVAPGTYTDLYFFNHDGSYDNPSWKDF